MEQGSANCLPPQPSKPLHLPDTLIDRLRQM